MTWARNYLGLTRAVWTVAVLLATGWASGRVAVAAEVPIRPDQPNAVGFAEHEARFVRFVIHASSGSQPCIDELEVYGPAGAGNLAAAKKGAKATAGSCLAGYREHSIEHLNDGRYGNQYSWIAATTGTEWAQIELPAAAVVSKVVFSRDRGGRYADRVPIKFDVLLSLDGVDWQKVKSVTGIVAAVPRGRNTAGGFVPSPPPPPVGAGRRPLAGPGHDQSGPSGEAPSQAATADLTPAYRKLLEDAFLAEEHAWLKTFGYADLSSRLVPYNGRVKQYPRHAPDDSLPLPPLPGVPTLDGRIDDDYWQAASRGIVRVAHPYDFELGPLVETAVMAGHDGSALYLAVTTDRLLSSHVAVLSAGDGRGKGVVVWEEQGLYFKTYEADGSLKRSIRLAGAASEDLTCFEFRLPLELFADCRRQGLRVGLGMGGKHTRVEGRAVEFSFAPFAIAQTAICVDRTFRVRLAVPDQAAAVTLAGNVPRLAAGLTLRPGQSETLSIPAAGPVGAEFSLVVEQEGGKRFSLRLLRYDPLARTLTLAEGVVERMAKDGRDTGPPRRELARLRRLQDALQAADEPDQAKQRRASFAARLWKRRLLLAAPELHLVEKVLFVKRHAFEPSHNYSVLLDSRYRPGGGVFVLAIPRHDGVLQPARAELTRLFDAAGGIARNPVASFDATRVYFGYRPAADGYFHIQEMDRDGGNVKRLTGGSFHDYWPCPLPDGGLAFISTRCHARFICWRPQAAVLFRMNAGGGDIRPLSFANLTEWGPSVMSDGRIIWQRSEYVDKGADFSHTLWAIRPDGTHPELVFGNDIIQPNGYANGREVPGTGEVLCTLISHFGDLNGPLALLDPAQGRFNPEAITSLTPEVPWPGMWPKEECFRDPMPLSHDFFLCAHAPRGQFGLYVIDRYGNREVLYLDEAIGSMCPTPFRAQETPPVLPSEIDLAAERGEFFLADVYRGIEPQVQRGRVKYIRVCQEVRADLEKMPDGTYRTDHPSFQDWYATPVHKVAGPFGWPSYVAKGVLGIVPVEADGSARFYAPAGKVLYFEVLDEDFNELQRMRSVVQLQPGERRACIGCHESRGSVPEQRAPLALGKPPRELEIPPWGDGPFAYEEVVQPVWDRHCISCHDARDDRKLDFTATLDADKVPASYRTLISQGWVHYLDYGWNSGGNEKREPLTFGTVKSRLWQVIDHGHYGVELTAEDKRRVKCWTDLNCPLWPDYTFRGDR